MIAKGGPDRSIASVSGRVLRLAAVVSVALVVCSSGCGKSPRDQVLIASMTDNAELLKQMDARGADLNAQYPERFTWTPLMSAIYFQSTNVIHYLLNRGVDVTKRSGTGDTALLMAIHEDDADTVTLLFQSAPRALLESENWPQVRSATQASGGNEQVRHRLSVMVDEFLKTNTLRSSKP